MSAKLLFDAGDLSGARNRAYYAMHDAARAALLAGDESVNAEAIKTHSGLIADYSDDGVDRERGLSAIEQANQFVDTVSGFVGGLPRRPG